MKHNALQEENKNSDTKAVHETKLTDQNHLEKLDVSSQGNDPADSSLLVCEQMIAQLKSIIYKKTKVLIECQKLAEYGTELIDKKDRIQKILRKLNRKQMRKYSKLEMVNSKKHEFEQRKINLLTERIKRCGERINKLQMRCEKDYPMEKIESIFKNVRAMQDAEATMDVPSQTAVNNGPSCLENLKEQQPSFRQLEVSLKEAQYRQSKTIFLHRSIAHINLLYYHQAQELLLISKKLLEDCLRGKEMVHEIHMQETNNMDTEGYQDIKEDDEENCESTEWDIEWKEFTGETDEMK